MFSANLETSFHDICSALLTMRQLYPQLQINFSSEQRTLETTSTVFSVRQLLTYPKPFRLPTTTAVADSNYIHELLRSRSLLLVEILSVIDVAKPVIKQRGTTAEDVANNQDVANNDFQDEEVRNSTSRRRLAKLLMSDGVRFIVGVEYRPLSFIPGLLETTGKSLSRTVLGRALLFNQPECIEGILLLQEANIRLLSSQSVHSSSAPAPPVSSVDGSYGHIHQAELDIAFDVDDQISVSPIQNAENPPLTNQSRPTVFYGLCWKGKYVGSVTQLDHVLPWSSDGFIDSRPHEISVELWERRQVPIPSDQAWVVQTVSAKHQRLFSLLVRVRKNAAQKYEPRQIVIELEDSPGDGRRQNPTASNPSTSPPDILVLSESTFNQMHRHSSGLFLCRLFGGSATHAESVLWGTNIPRAFRQNGESICLDGEIVSWSPRDTIWPGISNN